MNYHGLVVETNNPSNDNLLTVLVDSLVAI